MFALLTGQKKRNPDGEVLSILGHINDPGVDILSIIYQYDLPKEFPKEVMDQVEKIELEVPEEDKKGRRDLRHIPMVTIDGEDAKDLDDAISIEQLSNGNFLLGVHIADVTHYVKENTPFDKEALDKRYKYLSCGQGYPYVPHKLSTALLI